MKLSDNLLTQMQSHLAEVAIGTSSLRNQGASGVIAASRRFLSKVDLIQFNQPSNFISRLEKTTLDLQKELPEGGNRFGTARKAINLFLRDCLYNKILCDRFGLDELEAEFEVPLDKDVTTYLAQNCRPRKYFSVKVANNFSEGGLCFWFSWFGIGFFRSWGDRFCRFPRLRRFRLGPR